MTTLKKLVPKQSFGWFAVPLIALVPLAWIVTPTARRSFIRNAAVGAVASVLALCGAGVGLLLWPKRSGALRRTFAIAPEDVPAVNAPPFLSSEGRFYLAHNADGLLALSWRCTHKGCRTHWVGPVDSPAAYRCPCHSSTFDANGVRTGGPARRPFDLLQLSVGGDGSIKVTPASISTRSSYLPEQAVAYPRRQ